MNKGLIIWVQVHNEASPADALFEQRTASSNGSSSDSSISNGAAREADKQGSSPDPQPASSDWYGQARQGHSLRDFLASQAARLQEETRQGKAGTLNLQTVGHDGSMAAEDWYGHMRQGHSPRYYLTSEAARLQEETRQGEVQVQSFSICWDLHPVWHCVSQ